METEKANVEAKAEKKFEINQNQRRPKWSINGKKGDVVESMEKIKQPQHRMIEWSKKRNSWFL